jgi:hypothetical protein
VRPKENVVKILKDIDLLQLSQNEEIFEKGSRMFVTKWKEEQNEFIKYFQNEWLVLNRNWFEGIQKMIPSTNNDLEVFNRVIKNENILRERLPISRFSIILKEYIRSWSLKYTARTKEVHLHPVIDLELWTKSYQWVKQGKKITSNGHTYTVPSKDAFEIELRNLEKNKNMDFHNFEEYKSVMFNVWTTTIPENQNKWMQGECNCPVQCFLKNKFVNTLWGLL